MWILDAVAHDQPIIRLPRHKRSLSHIDWLIYLFIYLFIHSCIYSFIDSQAFVRRHLTRLSGAVQQYHDKIYKQYRNAND